MTPRVFDALEMTRVQTNSLAPAAGVLFIFNPRLTGASLLIQLALLSLNLTAVAGFRHHL